MEVLQIIISMKDLDQKYRYSAMNDLTVNGIWGGGSTPLLQDFFVKNIGILYAYDFLTLLLKFY